MSLSDFMGLPGDLEGHQPMTFYIWSDSSGATEELWGVWSFSCGDRPVTPFLGNDSNAKHDCNYQSKVKSNSSINNFCFIGGPGAGQSGLLIVLKASSKHKATNLLA